MKKNPNPKESRGSPYALGKEKRRQKLLKDVSQQTLYTAVACRHGE
jgi:hypothetical protein